MTLSPLFAKMLRDNKGKYSRSTNRTVKPKEGKTKYRLLAASPDDKFWRDLGVHWIKTEPGGKPVAAIGCNDAVYDESCAICTAIEKSIQSALDDDTRKFYREWKARHTVIVNALVRSGSDASDEPVILELTKNTFGSVLGIMEEYGNIADLKDGIDIVIERKGKGLDTEYLVMPAAKSEPVPSGMKEKLYDLDEFVKREFFKGEEAKALRAIGSVAGVTVALPTTSGSARTTSLLSTSVPVDDMDLEVLTSKKTVLTKSSVSSSDFGEDIPDDELDRLLGELGELKAS